MCPIQMQRNILECVLFKCIEIFWIFSLFFLTFHFQFTLVPFDCQMQFILLSVAYFLFSHFSTQGANGREHVNLDIVKNVPKDWGSWILSPRAQNTLKWLSVLRLAPWICYYKYSIEQLLTSPGFFWHGMMAKCQHISIYFQMFS